MKIESHLSLEDYKAFARAAQRRTVARHPMLRVARGLFLILLLAFLVTTFLPFEGVVLTLFVVGGPFLFIGIALGLAWALMLSSAVTRPAPEGRALGPRTTWLEADGVRVEGRHHETTTRWSGVHDLVETPTHLFIFVDNMQGLIVPKRDLTGEVTAEMARRVVEQGMSTTQRKI